ncbi:MAG: ABC transporter permease [Chitinophagales bacterium]|nr:ABC transporter permease [Chitinophagales bacterium]
MKRQWLAIQAEFLKIRHSSIVWVSFIAFALAPLMGAIFILIAQHPEAMAQTGALAAKAEIMNFGSNWTSYLNILTQAIGVGGVLIFGFVSSWIFGREYSEGTAKDLLSLAVSRTKIINAKFIVYMIWCLTLAISNLLVGFLLGSILQLPPLEMGSLAPLLIYYLITTLLTIIIGTPIAFFAIWGKGYLPPLGFVALTLVLAQIIAAIGYGTYFPWSIPGLYSGAGGEYKELLNYLSYTILVGTGLVGYIATVRFWEKADQSN